jgi:signal transduction histidine kinase
MRERAAALGGTLETDRSGGRFRVAAELPYHLA